MSFTKMSNFTFNHVDNAPQPIGDQRPNWDSRGNELKNYINNTLTAQLEQDTNNASGADNIGATQIAVGSGNKVMQQLKWLWQQIQNIVLGQIPDGSLTDAKLSDDAGQIKDRFNSHLSENATLTAKGHVQLYDGTDSDSTTLAATAHAVKQAFQFANDGKTGIANAVTAKGVSASPSDTFATLAAKIGQISTGAQLSAGESLILSSNADSQYVYQLTKLKEIKIKNPGTVRVKFQLYGIANGTTNYAQIYINDIPKGILRSNTGTGALVFTEDITVKENDNIQIYGRNNYTQSCAVLNFGIYINTASLGTVIL